MIGRPAHARRIFFKDTEARNRLARVQQGAASSGNGVDIFARHGRNTRQMLHRIKGRTLGSEHRARASF